MDSSSSTPLVRITNHARINAKAWRQGWGFPGGMGIKPAEDPTQNNRATARKKPQKPHPLTLPSQPRLVYDTSSTFEFLPTISPCSSGAPSTKNRLQQIDNPLPELPVPRRCGLVNGRSGHAANRSTNIILPDPSRTGNRRIAN